MNTLLNKEHDDFSSLYWITKLHKNPQKRIIEVVLLFQQSNCLYIWLTFWLLSKREYNYTGTKSINVVASIKCGYWNTARICWIDSILVFFILKIVSVQKFDCYSLETTRCCTLCRAKNTPTRSFVSNVYISQHSLPENAVKTWKIQSHIVNRK